MAKKLSKNPSAVRKRTKTRIRNTEEQMQKAAANKNYKRFRELNSERRAYKAALQATYKFDPKTHKMIEGYSPEKRAKAIEELIDVTERGNKLVDRKLNAQITQQTRIELNKASIGEPAKYTKTEQNIFYQKTKKLWEMATDVKDRNQLIIKNGGYNNLKEAIEDILGTTENDIKKAYETLLHEDQHTEEEIKAARRLLQDNFDAQQVSPPTRKQQGNIPERATSKA